MTDSIEQAMTRHQIQIQRLAGGNYREIVPILKSLSKDLRDMILKSLDTETAKTMRITQAEAKLLINSAVEDMGETLFPEFEKLAIYEEKFVRSIYDAAVVVEMVGLSFDQIESALTNSKMTLYDTTGGAQQLTIKQAFKQFDSTVVKEVNQKIIGGFASGQTSKQIANSVYRMTNNRTMNQAEALVRTSTNHVASVSRERFYKENDEVIKGERYTATLDNRTTIFCAKHDGRLYKIGQGPQTPAHWNCRSIRVAEVYAKYKIPGLAETRSSIDGPIPASTTYGDFLKKQSSDFQNEVLGKTRAELFRSGKVSIDQFSDFGRVLTVKELEKKYL